MKKIKFTLHPFLFGLFPVLALLANNIVQVEAVDAIRPIGLTFVAVAIVLFISGWLAKDWVKAAIFSTFVTLLFFSYGHLHLYLQEHTVLGIMLARVRYLLPLYLFVFIVVTWRIYRSNDLANITRGLNIIGVIILIAPLYRIAVHEIKNLSIEETSGITGEYQLTRGENLPDIYYILLDGYSRGDILEEVFEFSNYEFLEFLEASGFFIAECSQANYSWTQPSMAATFSMNYLDAGTGFSEIVIDSDTLYRMIRYDDVREIFERLGYTTIAFETGFKWLHWYDSDYFMSSVGDETSFFRRNVGLNDFELMLIETSAGRLLFDLRIFSPEKQSDEISEFFANPRELHRKRILNTLDSLLSIPKEIPSPKFVYAHIISPHDPYIFGAEGEWLQILPDDDLAGYRDQLRYLNTRIKEIIEKIIAESSQPPIIILQGDHGAPIKWKSYGIDESRVLGILNAYYLPNVVYEQYLYNSISPVNTFRLVMDQYFNGNLGYLEDKSIIGNQSPNIHLPCMDPG